MQGASLETVLLSHPAWKGLVKGMVVNKGGSESGLPSCNSKTNLAVIQDAKAGALWAMLGIPSNTYIVVDQGGKIILRLTNGNLPTDAAVITENVNGALGF